MKHGLAVASFATGAIAGFAAAGRAPRWSRGRYVLGGELVLLLVFAALWDSSGPTPAMIVLGALAMGVQSALAIRLDLSGISTTYLTGTLTAFLGQLADLARPDVAAYRRVTAVLAVGAGALIAAAVTRWAHGQTPWIAVAAVLIALAALWERAGQPGDPNT